MQFALPGLSSRLTLAAALAACLSLVGCGSKSGQPGDPAAQTGTVSAANPLLSDTVWRLVEIQSMDDAVGTKRPDDRDKYTMHLRPDGTVTMRLDCNQASGTWTSEPASDEVSGRFGFGPLAGTRALCPPPSIGELITTQTPVVRGYLLKDGRLHLSLLADGGILVWEPADIEAPFVATPDTALEAAVLAAHPGFTRKVAAGDGASEQVRYIHGRADLNADGREEVFVFVMGSIFCGTGGCSLMLFSEDQGRYTLVKEFPESLPPVIVSPQRTLGWNDLIRIESGRGSAPLHVRHRYDGKTYVEAERTPVGEVPPEGRWLLAGELGPNVGAPLTPRE
jgi:heat shock protein HslJ